MFSGGEWGYTQAMIERGLATGELRLDRRRRCSTCGDQQQGRELPMSDTVKLGTSAGEVEESGEGKA